MNNFTLLTNSSLSLHIAEKKKKSMGKKIRNPVQTHYEVSKKFSSFHSYGGLG